MTLLSIEENEKLVNCPWIMKRSEGKAYYMKYNFDIPNEYLLLLTDLHLVWFEHGNYERMRENAENELNMDLNDRDASSSLLERIKTTFKEKVLRCNLRRIPGHIKILLSLEDQKKTGITRLDWIFDCRLLDSENENHGYLNGPQFIFQHFILPSQIIVNHFTENVIDEYTEKLKVGPSGATFTPDSLDYISSLANKNKSNGSFVAQNLMVEQVGEDEKERLEQELKQEEKRKREIEKYNLKLQQQPKPKKKRRI